MNSIPRRGVLALGLGSLASLSGCLGFSTSRETNESFERSFPAADVATLQVLTPVGGVTVVGVRDDLLLDVLAESTGRVGSDLSPSELVADRNRLTGRLNGGGHRLHAYSDVGDVSLRALRSTA
jgi:hypothetical protein